MKLAVFGGLYSNYLALAAAITDARKRGADQLYCLGDMGAFGPHPDRVFPLLHEHHVQCVQGNYDDSIGNELNDCQCGYTDPRDNYFAQLSYDYTLANTNSENKVWLQGLPVELRAEIHGRRILFCHGSPRRTNEFLWESTTSTAFLNRLADEHQADLMIGTHSGIHWQRSLAQGRLYVNVGVLGRPENDGTTNVWYTMISLTENRSPQIEFIPVEYDYQRLADEMRAEKLPDEFVETVLTGWWTTCLEILPAKERLRGQF
ncbi:MAG TPA: metallophosphoesterase [Planctomycetaceae bacterium]|nr:metallophosphoesterase [Planctomycetaceae bacterium]